MNTPTPGAASELQADTLLRDLGKLRSCLGFGAITFGSEIIERLRKFVEAHNAPPAPVMEGAQREAVAWRTTTDWAPMIDRAYERICAVQEWHEFTNWLADDVFKAMLHMAFDTAQNMPTPPPPDRVQPERVEAKPLASVGASEDLMDLGNALVACAGILDTVKFDWGNDWSAWDQRVRDSITYHLTHLAPPTDASGGVTDAMFDAAYAAFQATWEHRSPDPVTLGGQRDRDRLRAALEAADRARKPVDASAQADVWDMRLCDYETHCLHPDVLYRFTVDPECEHCAHCDRQQRSEECPDGCKWCAAAAARVSALHPPTAQAASAGEPVAWVDGADLGFLRDRGQRLTALSMTQDLPCMVPLYAAPTPVAAYREVTITDAERIKESADGVPPLQSETNDMLAALNEHGAVIRTDGQQAQPE